MDWSIFNTGTTETWREGRKLLDGSLRPGAMISYRQMMQEKTREFLSQLLATPKDFHAHIELSVRHHHYVLCPLMPGQLSRKTSHVPRVWL
jgi:cytochrome P450